MTQTVLTTAQPSPARGMSWRRGALYLAIGQGVFLLSSYAISLGFSRLLGPEAYGRFRIVAVPVEIIDIVLLSSIPKALAKFMAERKLLAARLIRQAGYVQGVLVAALFILYFALAAPLAHLLHDPSLAAILQISAVLLPVSAFRILEFHVLNAHKAFGKQTLALVMYSLARVTLMLIPVWLGYAVPGALIGWILASLLTAGLLRWLHQPGRAQGEFPLCRLLSFAWQRSVYSCATILVMNLDTLFVKALLRDDALVGFYGAGMALARAPRLISLALPATMLPSLARMVSEGGKLQAGQQIRNVLRVAMLFLCPAAVVLSALATPTVVWLFGPVFVPAASVLSVLAFGLACLALFTLLTTILAASGEVRASMLIGLALVPLAVGLHSWLIPIYELRGAAWATTIAFVIGVLLASGWVLIKFGTLIRWTALMRIALVSGALYFVARAIPLSGWWVLASYTGSILVYGLSLLILGEIGMDEIGSVITALTGRRGQGGI